VKKLTLFGLIIFLQFTYAKNDFGKLVEEFDQFEKSTTPFLKSLDKHIKRNVYDILANYENQDSDLVQKWFHIASQVTTNKELGFFIKKTDYKVRAILEKLIFDKSKPITAEDRKVLLEKFDFLLDKAQQNSYSSLNQEGRAKIRINFRTMPIVSNLTKKRDSNNKFIILKPKKSLILLHKITYVIYGRKVIWGYVKSEDNSKRGWINLKNTTFR